MRSDVRPGFRTVLFAAASLIPLSSAEACTAKRPESATFDDDDDGDLSFAEAKRDLPQAETPCMAECFEKIKPRLDDPRPDCSDPAVLPADCHIGPPRPAEVVKACQAVCRRSAGPDDDCPGLVEELKNMCADSCPVGSPDVQASCVRTCVRDNFGPALPACTTSRLFR